MIFSRTLRDLLCWISVESRVRFIHDFFLRSLQDIFEGVESRVLWAGGRGVLNSFANFSITN